MLLAELAQGIPSLPGARCRGREELFDQTISQADWDGDGTIVTYARQAAVQLCAGCTALAQCQAWVEGLPRSRRPRGVVAGQFTDNYGRRARTVPRAARRRVPNTPESPAA